MINEWTSFYANLGLQEMFFEEENLMLLGGKFVVMNMPLLFKTYAKKMMIGRSVMSFVEVECLNVLLDGNRSVAISDANGLNNWWTYQLYINENTDNIS
jgi:hypothetical protein